MPLLEVKSLKKYFPTPKGMLHAVDDVSIAIDEGQTLGVVGESGCGKSTLGRAILRLHEPTSGEVLFDGENTLQYSKSDMMRMRGEMQIIFQDPYASLNPRMTVGDIIADPIRIRHTITDKGALEDKVRELMSVVGIAERFINTYPHELDGGRRQRIGIARALALDPRFIVCDEPVSALDVSIQAQILNLMMDLQEQQNLAYLFITHDLSVVKHISDHIAVMYLGHCVETAPTSELFRRPSHPYTQALLDAIPIPNLSRRGRERTVLRGEVSSPINPGPGCRFAPRCPHARAQCGESDLRPREIGDGHYMMCIGY